MRGHDAPPKHRRFPVKVVADTLGVARSNLIERMQGATKPRGPYRRQGDDELLQAIRQLTDARPTYGYRRITALLNRARRASGAEPINHKRVFRSCARRACCCSLIPACVPCARTRAVSLPWRPISAGRPMCWRSDAGMARWSAPPSRSTRAIVRSSPGTPQPAGSAAKWCAI